MLLLRCAWIGLPLAWMVAFATLAHAVEPPRTISVSASGKIMATPDMATISAGVVTEAQTAAEALARNSVAMRKVIDGLRSAGIAARDIQTSRLDVQPRMDRPKSGRPSQILGYRVSNAVVVVVRELKALGGLVDRIVALGVNQLDGIQFGISGIELKMDEARRVAMRNAIRRATLYAQAGGASLGQVLTITEGVHRGGGGVYYRARRAAAMAAPVAPGELEVSVTVNVTWALR
ncbi:MAG: SIMPL domain-containing protein [Hyphomicrobiaceae bacterium]|nr:SIMPL domain-containing protein [Hyphomicrobiaceae bacterium]